MLLCEESLNFIAKSLRFRLWKIIHIDEHIFYILYDIINMFTLTFPECTKEYFFSQCCKLTQKLRWIKLLDVHYMYVFRELFFSFVTMCQKILKSPEKKKLLKIFFEICTLFSDIRTFSFWIVNCSKNKLIVQKTIERCSKNFWNCSKNFWNSNPLKKKWKIEKRKWSCRDSNSRQGECSAHDTVWRYTIAPWGQDIWYG